MIDANTRCARCVTANPPSSRAIVRAQGASLNSTGMPLGIVSDGAYEASQSHMLEPGDLLLLVTDGVVEAHDEDETLFGVKRILDTVRAHRDGTAREIVAHLFQAVRDFCKGKAQQDDMTAVIIKVGSS